MVSPRILDTRELCAGDDEPTKPLAMRGGKEYILIAARTFFRAGP